MDRKCTVCKKDKVKLHWCNTHQRYICDFCSIEGHMFCNGCQARYGHSKLYSMEDIKEVVREVDLKDTLGYKIGFVKQGDVVDIKYLCKECTTIITQKRQL